ncbi:MAG: sensor histidine kinase [Pseudobdellovibrio sp.]
MSEKAGQPYLEDALRADLKNSCLQSGIVSLLVMAIYEYTAWPILSDNLFNSLVLAVFLVLQALRIQLKNLDKFSNRTWFTIHLCTVSSSALCWSALLLNSSLLPDVPVELVILNKLIIIGLIGASNLSLAISATNYYAFISPIIVTQLLTIIIRHSKLNYSAGSVIMILLFVVFLAKQQKKTRMTWQQLVIHNHEFTQHSLRMLNNAKMTSLGEMAGGMAHEINNPLTIIYGRSKQLSQMVKDNSLDTQKLTTGLEAIITMTSRISDVIKALLDFSQEIKNQQYEKYSLKHMITDAMTFISAKFQNNSINIVINVDEQIQIECFPPQITQALFSVINNSYEALLQAPGERSIEFNCSTESSCVRLKITDTGCGVPENIRHKIFQPFFTTKDVGKGAGLGLSIAKGIVESHRGKIYFNFDSSKTELIIEFQRLN